MQNVTSSTRIALITGASRRLGLGFAVARKLAEQRFHVILAARSISQSEQVTRELRDAGFTATAVCLDLSDRSSIGKLAAHLFSTLHHLDVLVNNASAMPDFQTRLALAVDLDVLHAQFVVDVFGCWALIQALLPLLEKSARGRIVNVTSAAAQQIGRHEPGPLYSPAYLLAKYTLNALTATLAAALADTSILVNAVDPGSVASHPERGDDENDRPPMVATEGVVCAATLADDGPTGGLFCDGRPICAVPR